MRKCVLVGVTVLVAFTLLIPSRGSAQVGVFLGAGGTFPIGDYGEYAGMGWMLEGGVSYPITDAGLSVFGEGLLGSNGDDGNLGIDGDKTNLLGAFWGVELNFAPEADAGLFIFAEVGLLKRDVSFEQSPQHDYAESALSFGGGAGYNFPIGGLNGWVLGRYLHGQFDSDDGKIALFGASAGVSYPIGG
jgi:hypothetical protein